MLRHLPVDVVCEHTLENLARMGGFLTGIEIPEQVVISCIFGGDQDLAKEVREKLGSWIVPRREPIHLDPDQLAAASWIIQHLPEVPVERRLYPEFTDSEWEGGLSALESLGLLSEGEIVSYSCAQVTILRRLGEQVACRKSDFDFEDSVWSDAISSLLAQELVVKMGVRKNAYYCLPGMENEAEEDHNRLDFSSDVDEVVASVQESLLASMDEFANTLRESLLSSLASLVEESEGTNMTNQWLTDKFDEVYNSVCGFLRKKLPQSWAMDLVEDHAMNFVTNLIDKDTLRKTLIKRMEPNLPQMCFWAYQNSITDIRRWGSDASLRSSRGAQTQCQVRDRENLTLTVQVEEEYEEPGLAPCVGGLEQEDFEKTREYMIETLSKHVRGSRLKRYVTVMDGLMDGERVSDIAAREDIPRPTVSNIKRDLHSRLTREYQSGGFQAYL